MPAFNSLDLVDKIIDITEQFVGVTQILTVVKISLQTIESGKHVIGMFLDQIIEIVVIVTEEEMMDAIRLYVEKAHTIAEGAGAAPLAAAIKIKDGLKGKRVVLELSGGNITAQMLRDILCRRC